MKEAKRRYIKAAGKPGAGSGRKTDELENTWDALSATSSFDRPVAEMQMPVAKRGVGTLFQAPPGQLGRAAVAAAQKAKRRGKG